MSTEPTHVSEFHRRLTDKNSGAPPFVLVYHADSGALNAVGHALHKMIKPSTYACNLCALTHGFTSEKSAWKGLLTKYPNAFEILHLDEFKAKYPKEGSGQTTTPCILRHPPTGSLEVALSSEEIAKLPDTKALVDACEALFAKAASGATA